MVVKIKEVTREAASEAGGEEDSERMKDLKRGMTHTHVVEATDRRDSGMFGHEDS